MKEPPIALPTKASKQTPQELNRIHLQGDDQIRQLLKTRVALASSAVFRPLLCAFVEYSNAQEKSVVMMQPCCAEILLEPLEK